MNAWTPTRKLQLTKWAIRVSITLIALFVLAVFFFTTVLTARWLEAVKQKAENAQIQTAENAAAIKEHGSEIDGLTATVNATPTPTPKVAKRHNNNHPIKDNRPWFRKLFNP
jgi:ABC-type protease/lipase transport system fused ATPase/permease subunit